MADYTPTTEEVRDALIEGAKLDARNSMRSDPRVWHEALEAALDKVLPGFWDAARSSVLAEQGKPDDYWVLGADGEFWASSTSLDDARHYLAQDPGGWIEAVYRRRLPVEENGENA